jgi:hypothetical protein
VINLDGLVNNDIYAYAISNRLPSYIAERRITYVVDFKTMLDIPEYRMRGGYDDDTFLGGLRPIKLFDHGGISAVAVPDALPGGALTTRLVAIGTSTSRHFVQQQ